MFFADLRDLVTNYYGTLYFRERLIDGMALSFTNHTSGRENSYLPPLCIVYIYSMNNIQKIKVNMRSLKKNVIQTTKTIMVEVKRVWGGGCNCFSSSWQQHTYIVHTKIDLYIGGNGGRYSTSIWVRVFINITLT